MPMPVGVQLHGPRKRAERQTSSCTECRRRKQKCSQGQPCTNCVRRFPQPICEYQTSTPSRRHQQPHYHHGQTYTEKLKEGPYSHLSIAGVQDVILQVAEPQGRLQSIGPPKSIYFSYSSSPASEFEFSLKASNGKTGSPWVPFRVTLDEDNDPEAMLESLQVIFERRLSMANRIPKNDWVAEDAKAALALSSKKNVQSPIEGAMEQFRYLPMAPTKMNKELVRIHLQLLCRFKVSVDGSPAPNNPFMKFWVPFCVQDPLLLQIILFTSACFFSETGHIPKILAMMHKGKAYHMLNEQLRSEETQVSDASILGVTQMVVDSWYWGATTDLKAHIRGLRQMIQMRGGFANLGLHGYLAKTILIHDIVMALAHEIDPCIYGHRGFEFKDPIMMPFHIALNSPLIFGWPSFAGCSTSLQLHPSTAMILDDIRFLIESVLAVPENASTAELQQIMTTAGWVMDRISELPEDTPVQVPEYHSNPASPDAQSPGSCRSGRSDKSSPPVELPDQMYRCVRMTALIYCRAILNRVPTSEICTEMDYLRIWQAAWLATLPTWKATVGVLIWMLLAIVPSGHNAGPARFLKTLMISGLMSIGVDNWHIALDIANTGLRLQRWLASGRNAFDDEGKGLMGGEMIVDRYGFAIKEVLPPVLLPLDEDEDE